MGASKRRTVKLAHHAHKRGGALLSAQFYHIVRIERSYRTQPLCTFLYHYSQSTPQKFVHFYHRSKNINITNGFSLCQSSQSRFSVELANTMRLLN
jgi:hypothetical protein